MATNTIAVVCDIGGTNLRISLVDKNGRLHATQIEKNKNYKSERTPNEVVNFLLLRLKEFLEQTPHDLPMTAPLVCSVPGPVEHRKRLLSAPPLLGNAQWPHIPDINKVFAAELQRPVYLINDVSAAAWYLSTEETITARRFFVVTISSGIGSKIFDRDHELGVIDDRSFSGEIGHFRIDQSRDAPKCDCGGYGHLGALASGRGFERMAREEANSDPMGFGTSKCAQQYGAEPCTLSNEKHLVKAIKAGDEWAKRILQRSIRYIAPYVVATIVSAGIEKVMLIGGLAQSLGAIYSNLLTSEIDAIVQKGFAPETKDLIEVRAWDEQTCLKGAAEFATRHVDTMRFSGDG